MASDESWVFDSLVNFLHGNIWKIPVIGFIEEKSVVFDPDSYNNMTDDKEDEFRKIHEEYKGLVDFMLSSFMEDLQVSPEQVEEACRLRETGKAGSESHVTKSALEQLQAAEDFTVFRRIMTRKNIDLQLQSLELLVAKYGVLSPSLRSQEDTETSGENGEDDFLQVVIRYCDQNDIFQSTSADSDPTPTTPSPLISSTIHNALKSSSSSSQIPVKPGQNKPQPVEKELEKSTSKAKPATHTTPPPQQVHASLPKTSEKALPKDEPQKPDVSSTKSPSAGPSSSQLVLQDMSDLVELEPSPRKDSNEETTMHPSERLPNLRPTKGGRKSVKFDETTVAEIATVAPEQHRTLTSFRKALDTEGNDDDSVASSQVVNVPSGGGSEEDIQRRREYLTAQRDKLVALKKREREKQFAKQEGESQSQRPKSARAAKIALTSSSPESSNVDQNEKQLAARRALAERLKQELFEK